MTKPVLAGAAIAILVAAAIYFSTTNGEPEGAARTDALPATTSSPADPGSATGGSAAADLSSRPNEVVAPAVTADDFNPEIPRHGSSLFGDLKYGPDFKHFDYVNPDAPTGGLVRYGAFGSFDSLNGFIVKGQTAAGLGMIYDTLMVSSMDEPASEYGLIAESVRHPKDYSSVTYTLRPQARWHDGEKTHPR